MLRDSLLRVLWVISRPFLRGSRQRQDAKAPRNAACRTLLSMVHRSGSCYALNQVFPKRPILWTGIALVVAGTTTWLTTRFNNQYGVRAWHCWTTLRENRMFSFASAEVGHQHFVVASANPLGLVIQFGALHEVARDPGWHCSAGRDTYAYVGSWYGRRPTRFALQRRGFEFGYRDTGVSGLSFNTPYGEQSYVGVPHWLVMVAGGTLIWLHKRRARLRLQGTGFAITPQFESGSTSS